MKEITVECSVNGVIRNTKTSPDRLLVDFLREDLGLTSVKKGCGEGECGACTVLLNGIAVTSCTMLAGQASGSEIITLEGVGDAEHLDPIQTSFMEAGAVQCGYCTPGMILSAKALLMNNPKPSEDEIRRAMSGNLCRCTGYTRIIKAVEMASIKMAEGAQEEL